MPPPAKWMTGHGSTCCASTPSAPWPWTRSRRPIPAIRARRWRWLPWPIRCGRTACATIRDDPIWPNRDRFVLSNGHASMLLYALLHLAGVQAVTAEGGRPAVTLDDIKQFRQFGSRCPGHPEYGSTSGVETTTGPLGQGCGNSVGMAIGERWLAQPFQPAGLHAVRLQRLCVLRRRRHDGGRIASEAASLAGHLQLSQPVLDLRQQPHHDRGPHRPGLQRRRGRAVSSATAGTCCASAMPTTPSRWRAALEAFRSTSDRPTLIIVDSHIGYGAPHKQDTSAAHGEPLGEEEIRLAKRSLRLAGGCEVPGARRRATNIFAPASATAARELRAQLVRACSRAYRSQYPELADAIRAHAARASCPTAGTRICRCSRRRRRASPPANSSGKVAERHRAALSLADRRRRRPRRPRPRRG